MEEEIDLRQLWEALKKRWILIAVIPLLFSIISGLVSFYYLKPVYQATTTMFVGKKLLDISQSDSQLLEALQNYQRLSNESYATIVKSRTVLENVIKEMGLPLAPEQLGGKITVKTEEYSEVLKISVTDGDPEQTARIANTVADKFAEAVIKITSADSVSVVDPAITPGYPIKPNKTMNVLIAFAVGLMASIGLAFILEFLDNTVKTTKDVKDILGLPVLGVIPLHKHDHSKRG